MSNLPTESVRKSLSIDEMQEKARLYMREMYGIPRNLPEEAADRWRERFGLLLHFIDYGLWEIDKHG